MTDNVDRCHWCRTVISRNQADSLCTRCQAQRDNCTRVCTWCRKMKKPGDFPKQGAVCSWCIRAGIVQKTHRPCIRCRQWRPIYSPNPPIEHLIDLCEKCYHEYTAYQQCTECMASRKSTDFIDDCAICSDCRRGGTIRKCNTCNQWKLSSRFCGNKCTCQKCALDMTDAYIKNAHESEMNIPLCPLCERGLINFDGEGYLITNISGAVCSPCQGHLHEPKGEREAINREMAAYRPMISGTSIYARARFKTPRARYFAAVAYTFEGFAQSRVRQLKKKNGWKDSNGREDWREDGPSNDWDVT